MFHIFVSNILLLSSIPYFVHATICSPIGEHLDYIQWLATTNNATMNTYVKVLILTHTFISLG
jgi:hypothetical protein